MSCVRDRNCCSCSQTMAKYWIVVFVFALNVENSFGTPPKLSRCREIYKAKQPTNADPEWTYTYVFEYGACGESVPLGMRYPVTNFTDSRNCQNYYRCQGLSCSQCPCPENETFNPLTLQCDTSASECKCQGNTPETTVIIDTSTSQSLPTTSKTTKTIPEKIIPARSSTLPYRADDQNSPNGIVIIVVIIALTVVILLALIVGFCLWQRGVFPLKKDANMHPSNNDGYLHTLPAQERHVYAEIADGTVDQEMQIRGRNDELRRQLHHTYAPPISITSPTAASLHPHETFVLPANHQLRQYPQIAAYPNSPQTTTIQNVDWARLSAGNQENKGNTSQNNNQTWRAGCCPNCLTDNSSTVSCSDCSNCSTQETIDRSNLLNYSHCTPHHPQLNFVSSRQEYV